MHSRIVLVVVLAGCTSKPTPRAEPASVPPAQTIAEGVRALCDSGWDGHVERERSRDSIPDRVAAKVTNDEVRHLMNALAGGHGQRHAPMIDAFLAENGLVGTPCPLRDHFAAVATAEEKVDPRCRKTCAREAGCARAGDFAEEDCVTACSLLADDSAASANVDRHIACTAAAADCAAVNACR